MAISYDDERLKHLEEKLKGQFRLSNPGFWEVALSPKYKPYLGEVHGTVYAALHADASLDQKRGEMEREEAARIAERRVRHAPPPMAGQLMQSLGYPHSPAEEAKLNVAAQIERIKRERALDVQQKVFRALQHGEEYARLDPTQIRPQHKPTDLTEELELNTERMMREDRRAMVKELAGHIEDGDQARQLLNQTFVQGRRGMIEKAKEQGEQHPEQAVSNAFQNVSQLIDEYEKHRLYTTFNQYGYDHIEKQNAKEEAQSFIYEHEEEQEQDNRHDRQQAPMVPAHETAAHDDSKQLAPAKHKAMVQEVTHVIEQGSVERHQLHMIFDQNRDEMLKIAQESGSENPEQTLATTFKISMTAIEDKEERQLSRIFEHYGHKYTQGHAREEAQDILYQQAYEAEEKQEQALEPYQDWDREEYNTQEEENHHEQ